MANFDNSAPRPLAQASAKGTVKWFNSTKGYGFITLENGGDAFCHASALAALGTPNVPQGATVVCDLQESPRGLQVVDRPQHGHEHRRAHAGASARGPMAGRHCATRFRPERPDGRRQGKVLQ